MNLQHFSFLPTDKNEILKKSHKKFRYNEGTTYIHPCTNPFFSLFSFFLIIIFHNVKLTTSSFRYLPRCYIFIIYILLFM